MDNFSITIGVHFLKGYKGSFMKKYDTVWNQALELIKPTVTETSFNTWFKEPLKINSIDNELKIVYLQVDTKQEIDFMVSLIKNRFSRCLTDAFREIFNEEYKIVVKHVSEYENNNVISEKNEKPEKPARKKKTSLMQENYLNPKFTFDNFVVGPSNRYAQAAALAVANNPGDTYNPLFIYGGSGLGKTHLIQAIGIKILEKNPDMNILYTDAETFTNELVASIKTEKTNEFKSKYRKVDVLIVDDVQFLEGKERIQEEFFYTFNSLYERGKQIILSSDRPPSKLEGVDERLIGRFQWNMMADIQPADYETRVAILLKMAENNNLLIDDELKEVINLICEKIKNNIRELEGAFNRIVSFSMLMNEKLDKNLARRVLRDILNNGEISVTPEKIKKTVCKYFNIKISDIESSKKANNIAFPRQIAMYLIRELTDSSFPQIGKYLGGKHYTTVMYACDKIESDIKLDEEIYNTIENLKREIMD